MFGRKKDERPKRNHGDRNLAQYGLFDVPTDLSFDGDTDGMDNNDDDDLEAELLALTSDSGSKSRIRKKPKQNLNVNLDAMVAASLKDIPSDEEISDEENDPDLLNELSELTHDELPELEAPKPVTEATTSMAQLLQERLKMYIAAEENAKKNGESGRARRFNRGMKTLKDLIKQEGNGKAINTDDIPPEVSISVKTPIEPNESTIEEVPVQPPEPPKSPDAVPESTESTNVDQELLNTLNKRKTEYKIAALEAKKTNDIPTAINYMKIAKQFDVVIKAVENGQEVDLSKMPGSPGETERITVAPIAPAEDTREEETIQTHEEEVSEEPQLITAESVEEALAQRLQVYKTQEENAKAEGNTSKARRMGRIVKQYEQAIKSHKAGKPILVDDLPTPPGYAPIPVPGMPKPEPSEAPSVSPSNSGEASSEKASVPLPPPRSNSARKTGNQAATTLTEKLVTLLLNRQKEFKEAAIQAKKKNELTQAKEFLRTAKGFDKVIEAARCGLPVDMESLPIPPSARSELEDSFHVVMNEECQEDDSGNLDILSRLEDQLNKQLKMCLSTRDHHKALGDVAGMNRFEHMALSVTKDLDIIRIAQRANTESIPKFHYENRSFSIVKCCTDLNDNDFELTIVRGINFGCTNPKEIDTYVKFEFPYPQEEPFKDRTSVIKDTNNPDYNATFVIPINRTARPCLRIFKRQAVKLEIYSRGCWASNWDCCFSGFFRGDTLIGTINIKLQPLETQCELHDSYDLLDGRKKVGGKLEVRFRVRHPMLTRQVEQLSEKWLVIDH